MKLDKSVSKITKTKYIEKMDKADNGNGKDNELEKENIRKAHNLKLATWNIRSINGKERELEDEFEKSGVHILGITETKKKGNGKINMENGHVLLYSGVDTSIRAAAGVGCIIHKELAKDIYSWVPLSQRILTIEMRSEIRKIWTIIVTYGPNEDDKVDVKERYWEELTETAENAKGKIFIVGDFNGRVGQQEEQYKEILGRHGEQIRNNNGNRLLDFCILNNFIITNSWFAHKDIHKYTREEPSRGEKSIIDYVLVEKANMRMVQDTRVKRGAEIGSDHYMVVSQIKELKAIENKETSPKKRVQK
jgi:exonuclease III